LYIGAQEIVLLCVGKVKLAPQVTLMEQTSQ